MDTKYLWKRHNTYWVRVRVPDDVRLFIGKAELSKNLYTKDLAEANGLKHREVSRLKKQIDLAKKRLDGSTNPPSRKRSLGVASSMRVTGKCHRCDLDDIQDVISTLVKTRLVIYMENKKQKRFSMVMNLNTQVNQLKLKQKKQLRMPSGL